MELIWIGMASLLAGLTLLVVSNLVLSESEGAVQQWGFKIGLALVLLGLTATVLAT